MGALGSTRQKAEAQRLLSRLQDGTKVRQHDVDYWLLYLLRNRHTRDLAWDWQVANWEWIEKTFSKLLSFDYFPRFSANAINSRHYLEKYKEFFEPLKRLAALSRNIDMGTEEIESRVSWLERDVSAVLEFLKAERLL
jgi:aminopeptidase N